jgi:hypothetical protein
MISRAELQERVDRGVAYMNDVKPGWVEMIDLKTFNLFSSTDCVIGQVFGTYCGHVKDRGIDFDDWVEMGFSSIEPELSQQVWVETIRALQESHKVTLPVSSTTAPAAELALAK